jgi:NADPH-dependent glutamate synthase beta subunit-like oxidoreductase
LEHDIDIVRKAGVKIKTRAKVTSVHQLKKQGFDAVFLALGAHASWKMGIQGENAPGVLNCVAFLRNVALGKPPRLGKRVAVVGGGNTAIDASRTALRLGAQQVTILYRRSREEMPAERTEIEDALSEGVKLELLTIPKIVQRTGQCLKVTCVRMRLGEPDQQGRRKPVPLEGSEFELQFDSVLSAIGQFPSIPKALGFEVDPNSQLISVHPDSFATPVEGVFAGGDVVSGPASVVQAIAHGRLAAQAIDRYLGGNGDITETLAPPEDLVSLAALQSETSARNRRDVPAAPAKDRVRGFSQVERGFSKRRAMEEALRCLRCDLRK